MKWEMMLKSARELRSKNNEMLHKRATLLVKCFQDKEFVKYCEEQHTNELEFLDAETDDLGVSFLTLKAVLDVNPDVETWAKHGFRYLLAEYYDSLKKDKEPRVSVSYKALYEEAKRTIAVLEAQVKALQNAISGKCNV